MPVITAIFHAHSISSSFLPASPATSLPETSKLGMLICLNVTTSLQFLKPDLLKETLLATSFPYLDSYYTHIVLNRSSSVSRDVLPFNHMSY